MTRSGRFSLCAYLTLSLTTLACGSSNSGGTTSTTWDQARIANTGTRWWMNAQKGAFFLEVRLELYPAGSPVDDTVGKKQAIDVTKIVAAKSGSTALSLVPTAAEIPGSWIVDPDVAYTANGPVATSDSGKAIEWFDGGADPFFDSTKSYHASAVAWENYKENDASKSDLYVLDLRVWQMASAADARSVYVDSLQSESFAPVTWATCTATDCP